MLLQQKEDSELLKIYKQLLKHPIGGEKHE